MTDPHDLERFNPTAYLLPFSDGIYRVTLTRTLGEADRIVLDIQAPTAADAKLEAIRRFRAVIDSTPIEGGQE